MGDCTFCGESAGLFRKEHPECRSRHDAASGEIRHEAERTALDKALVPGFRLRVEEIARAAYLNDGELATAVSEGFTRAIDHALNDNILTQEEDECLGEFLQQSGFGQEQMDFNALRRVTMAGALRDLMEGKIPKRINFSGDLPFNLESDEQLVWVWGPAQYAEERTHRTRVGGYGGPSLRIASGIYWHMGGFASQQIEQTAMEFVDKGVLAATTEHIYFKGQHKSLKIPYKKIVSWDAYSDGIGICQNGVRARPQVFVTGEGWFIYNLVRNLALLQAEQPKANRHRTLS
jgi:hypothetical protein